MAQETRIITRYSTSVLLFFLPTGSFPTGTSPSTNVGSIRNFFIHNIKLPLFMRIRLTGLHKTHFI